MDDTFILLTKICYYCDSSKCKCFETKLCSIEFNRIVEDYLKNRNGNLKLLSPYLRRVVIVYNTYPGQSFNKDAFTRGNYDYSLNSELVADAIVYAEKKIKEYKYSEYFKGWAAVELSHSFWILYGY